MDNINLSVIREMYGNVVYTHKTYEKAADMLTTQSRWMKAANVILLTLTSGSAIGAVFKGDILIEITAFLSTLTLLFAVYQITFRTEESVENYRAVARKLWTIREHSQNLIADILNNIYTTKEINEKRDALLSQLSGVLADAPSTNARAYAKARKSLKIEGEKTFTEAEIDAFLPDKLRNK